MTAWINGRAGTLIGYRDRGLQYGDGVFETMRVRGRRVRLLDFHLDRLFEGCRRLKIEPPKPGRLRRELESRAELRDEAVLKLIVTRGPGSRGYRPSGEERCTRVISLHAPPGRKAAAAQAAVRVRMCGTRLGINPLLAGIKTLNRLESVMARSEWRDPRIWEGLLRDVDGNIVSGTMSNLFIRSGSYLMTPILDRCGIAGVMRRWVLQQGKEFGLRPLEGRLGWEEIGGADEAFMTNAVAGVVSVALVQHGAKHIRFRNQDSACALRARLEAL